MAKQFSLFDDPQKLQAPIIKPEWEFQWMDHVDLIASEYVSGFLFDIDELGEIHSTYSIPVFKALLPALVTLSKQKKSWRSRSFSVFCGDCFGYNRFFIGFGLRNTTSDGELLMYLRHFFEKVPGFEMFDSGSSNDFLALWRYDNGYIISYSDPELSGKSYLDEEYGTGAIIYRRTAMDAETYGQSKSVYGQLKTPT